MFIVNSICYHQPFNYEKDMCYPHNIKEEQAIDLVNERGLSLQNRK
jgi:hypothetical protein